MTLVVDGDRLRVDTKLTMEAFLLRIPSKRDGGL